MKTLKDVVGPLRTNKKERLAQQERLMSRVNEKNFAMKKFGPDKSILADFRAGKLPRSAVNKIPMPRYNNLVSDNVSAFNKKVKKSNFTSVLDDDYFR